MQYKKRPNLIGVTQHVMHRRKNGEPAFTTDADYRKYLDDLRYAANKYDCQIHAYVLMPDHVHLLVTPMADRGVSKMMQLLGRRYVHYFNKAYDRSGTFWEGRYKSSLVDADHYLIMCMRYIELNPVRSEIVNDAEDYEWSSYTANALGKRDPVLRHHDIYQALGATPVERLMVYWESFRYGLDERTENEIRGALHDELILGHGDFKRELVLKNAKQASLSQATRPTVDDESVSHYVV